MSAMSASVTTDAETRILNTEADTSVDTATEAEVSVLSEGLLDSTMLTLKATLEDTIANPAPEEKPIEPAPVEPVLPTETEQPPVEPVVTPTPVSATTTTDMVSTITNDIVPPIVTEEEKTGTQINTFLRLKK